MYGSNYEIKEVSEECVDARPRLELSVNGIDALPRALKRLAELGYDMHTSLKALQSACSDQDKQSVLHAAINALTKPTEESH